MCKHLKQQSGRLVAREEKGTMTCICTSHLCNGSTLLL